MEFCPEESSPDRIVYREPPRPLIGGPITVLGSLLGLALLSAKPDQGLIALLMAGSGCAVVFVSMVVGLRHLATQRLALDRANACIVRSWHLLGFRNAQAEPLGRLEAVAWTCHEYHAPDASPPTVEIIYPIILFGRENDEFRMHCLFHVGHLEQARDLARQLASFLGIPARDAKPSSSQLVADAA